MELITALLIFVGLILLMLLPRLKPRDRNVGLGLNAPPAPGRDVMPGQGLNTKNQIRLVEAAKSQAQSPNSR